MKMNKLKKLRVFLASSAAVSAFTATSVFAKSGDIAGDSLTLWERFEYALQGTVTGLLMVFAVLALLWGIVSLSKVIFYDIPRKRKANEEKTADAVSEVLNDTAAPVQPSQPETDDAQLTAVITAAVAAMIESGEYKEEFAGGFRVVSFKRASCKKWNKN